MSDKIDVCVWCQECGTDLRFLLDRDGDGRLLISVYPCPVCEEQTDNEAFTEVFFFRQTTAYEMRRQQSSRYQ